MNRILVIGGTGTVGREVLSQLTPTGAQVRALLRNPDAARLPPQVEVARGDLTLPDTLDTCLDGIDSVFLVWTAPPATVAKSEIAAGDFSRKGPIMLLSANLTLSVAHAAPMYDSQVKITRPSG